MTVPMENIVGAANSDQMVGGHRGLGMLNNVINDPFRKLGRGGTSAKQQAKLMQYQSQLNREELAHKANVTHGEHIEMTKEGGFADELAKRMEYGVELDENGSPVDTYRGRRGPQQSPTSQTGDFNSPEQQQRVQTRQVALGGASARYKTSTGSELGVGDWRMSGQFGGGSPQGPQAPQGPQGPQEIPTYPPTPGGSGPKEITSGPAEENDIPDAEIIEDDVQAGDRPGTSGPSVFSGGGGTSTFVPVLHDLRGAFTQQNLETGELEAIPGRKELKEQNDRTAATARERRVRELEQLKKDHLERTGVDMPQSAQDEYLTRTPEAIKSPTAMSKEYDRRRQAGEPGFDRPGPLETIGGAGGPTPTRSGGTAGMGPATPAATAPTTTPASEGGSSHPILEGGIKAVAGAAGAAIGGGPGAALATGVAQAGIDVVKKRKQRKAAATPATPAKPAKPAKPATPA
jgi:hypothetical protein